MIVVVRNPVDSLLSYLHLVSILNHSGKVPFDFVSEYPNYFEWWVKHCSSKIKLWMAATMNEARLKRIPVLFLRFEDLVMNPAPELYNMMKFMIGESDLTGTNAERRI